MPTFSEDEYLMISGVQHYAFCPRQWGLIHIEDYWDENYLTAKGRVFHEKVHRVQKIEKRGQILIARNLRVSSATFGLSGECDVVEFHKSDKGVSLHNLKGLYLPYPIEYKRGKVKIDDFDRLQLLAQALCLEEMLMCEIIEGALFYGENKRREQVIFTKELREKLHTILQEMHAYAKRQHTPMGKVGVHCRACSLKEICLPSIIKKPKNIDKYFEEGLL